MRKWIVQALVPVLCGFALLFGVIAAGRVARASLRNQATYCLAFADIDCQPPEGMSRTVFLREVRSLAHPPEVLHLLDEDWAIPLYRAFRAHPWVESVRWVAINSPGELSSRRSVSVHVEMEYRRAVLVVPSGIGSWRMVDRHGIQLPESPLLPHLPVLAVAEEKASSLKTAGRDGDEVRIAAKTASFLQPYLTCLHLEGSQIDIIDGEIVFFKPGVRIVWGHAPGQENEGEAPAHVKLRRLLDYHREHNGLGGLEHDVRLLAYHGHFPLLPDETHRTVSFYGANASPSLTRGDTNPLRSGQGPSSNVGLSSVETFSP